MPNCEDFHDERNSVKRVSACGCLIAGCGLLLYISFVKKMVKTTLGKIDKRLMRANPGALHVSLR
jgi:hypothetical protein